MVNIITQSSDSFATYYYITTSDYRYVNFVDFDSQHLVPKNNKTVKDVFRLMRAYHSNPKTSLRQFC